MMPMTSPSVRALERASARKAAIPGAAGQPAGTRPRGSATAGPLRGRWRKRAPQPHDRRVVALDDRENRGALVGITSDDAEVALELGAIGEKEVQCVVPLLVAPQFRQMLSGFEI